MQSLSIIAAATVTTIQPQHCEMCYIQLDLYPHAKEIGQTIWLYSNNVWILHFIKDQMCHNHSKTDCGWEMGKKRRLHYDARYHIIIFFFLHKNKKERKEDWSNKMWILRLRFNLSTFLIDKKYSKFECSVQSTEFTVVFLTFLAMAFRSAFLVFTNDAISIINRFFVCHHHIFKKKKNSISIPHFDVLHNFYIYST